MFSFFIVDLFFNLKIKDKRILLKAYKVFNLPINVNFEIKYNKEVVQEK